MSDLLLRTLTSDGSLRLAVCRTTTLAGEICRRQQCDPTASVALGRLLSGTALLGALLKNDQRLGLMIEGNGPLQRLQAETDAEGHLRGTLKVNHCELPPQGDSYPVATAIGRAGFLHVTKDLGLKEPYRSMVQLQSSEIGEDIAYYLTTSEQVPSAVGLGVRLDAEGGIASAGGFLVQALPGCPEQRLSELETELQSLPPLSELLADDDGAAGLLQRLLGGQDHATPTSIPLQFQCRCNLRQIVRMLQNLPLEERQEMARGDEAVTVTCEYCRQAYTLQPRELAGLV